ncbi:MAG: nucleoside deaminase [Mycobacterium sp.]
MIDRRAVLLGAGALAGLAGASVAGTTPVRAEPAQGVDLSLLRRTFQLASEARAMGGAPYGALIADAAGHVVDEQRNTSGLAGGDPTRHAELVASANAWKVLDYAGMNAATLYASTEPCSMCAGAAYWTGIGRVVYGMSNQRLFEFTGDNPQHASFALPCRDILTQGTRPITVVGPLLENEAAQAHEGYWH